jgi:DNA polymerase-3 subunit alpha (Gram-positive type)
MNYCILDVETSGFSPTKNAICQLSAIIIDDDFLEVARFDNYIKPYNKWYDPKAEKVHKLTKQFLSENGEDINYVLNRFIEFINEHKPYHYVGHGIRLFDKKFVAEATKALFTIFAFHFDKASFYDTLEMSWIHKGVKSHSLKAMCHHFGIKHIDNHNSINDCESTVKLFKALKQ